MLSKSKYIIKVVAVDLGDLYHSSLVTCFFYCAGSRRKIMAAVGQHQDFHPVLHSHLFRFVDLIDLCNGSLLSSDFV